MSTPQGPRESTRGSRGRGRARGGAQTRDSRGDAKARPSFQQTPATTTSTSTTSQPFKPTSRQNGIRTRPPRGSSVLPSTRQGRAGTTASTTPKPAPRVSSGSRTETWRNPVIEPSSSYQNRMSDLFQTLKSKREVERRDAVKKGFLADPDRPTSLANAITPVGTCQDMCPEFERVERIVQFMVDKCEKTPSESGTKVPCEDYMVKRFRRSAAGYEEQLPSDIRPPLVLQKTLNYLFDEIIGGSKPLAAVQKFVWDRTRAIRNDFSIQQVTKVSDLRIAIDCFERIARFHILSLHQLSKPSADNEDFEPIQEREQLNNTLLSLMYYYDDSRHKMTSPNEAEFRAYCIIFEIQDQRPDLEDRAQQWPKSLLQDRRVQTALKLYAAAGNTSDEQGPLRPRVPFMIAQVNIGRFWSIIRSNAVPYLMACVAEVYFGFIRKTALETIWKAYKGKRGGPTKMEDWILDDLTTALGFDDEGQTQTFCEDHGFTIAETDNGEAYVDLGSVAGRYLEDTNPRRKQTFSKTLVEQKRLGRTLPAVINGLSASQAQSQGLVSDFSAAETSSVSDHQPLFMENSDEEQKSEKPQSAAPAQKDETKSGPTKLDPSASPFDHAPTPFQFSTPGGTSFASNGIFGKPTPLDFSGLPPDSSSIFKLGASETEKPSPFATQQTPKFVFPTIPDTSKQSSNGSFAPSPENGPTSQQKDLFKQPPSVLPKAPGFSFGTSALFGNSEQSKDLSGSSRDATDAAPKESTWRSASSMFPEPQTQAAPSTTPTSTIFNSPLPNPAFFPPPTTTSALFPTPTPTPLFPSPKTSSTLNEPPSTEASSPFSTSVPTAGNSMFPPLSNSNQSSPFTFAPSTSKAAPFETSSTTTTQSQPFRFQPPTASGPPFTANSQPAIPVSPMDMSQTLVQPGPSAVPSASPSNTPRSPFRATLSPAEQAKARPPRPDPRPAALDKLSDAMMMDDEGLLSQFIEYSIGPVIAASFHQIKDERSWAKAREVRAVLLSRKFFRKWQANAWKRGLLRKGKERRKNFAQSMRELAQSTRKRPSDLSSSSQSAAMSEDSQHRQHENQSRNTMPPPSQKRISLPAGIGDNSQTSDLSSNQKRKHHHSPPRADQITSKPHQSSHKRSSTVSDLSMSHPPRKRPRSPEFSRLGYSTLADGTIINEALMKKARQLAPRARTDTTNTDYFLLKSRGIDPNTPIVPETRKKRSTTLSENHSKSKNLRRLSPPNSSNSSLARLTNRQALAPTPPTASSSQPFPSSTPTKTNAEDEALFASLASVRSALAESISWFQSERAKSESLSQANSPPPNETEKQKRLREFQFTPSRTEQRMRASGAGHFWEKRDEDRRRSAADSAHGSPAGFVPMRTGVGAIATTMGNPSHEKPIGFPALANWHAQPSAFAARAVDMDGVQKEEGKGTGASVEDAIEL